MDVREELHVTVALNDRPVADEVVRAGGSVDAVPGGASVRRDGARFVLDASLNPTPVGRGEVAVVQAGGLTLTARVIRRFRHPRWILEQADIVLPLLMSACGVFAAQVAFLIQLLLAIFFPPAAASGPPEPSPEYLARLLNEDFDGADQGVYARPSPRPPSDTRIESFYLQSGAPGPVTEQGGGKVVGAEQSSGDPRQRKDPAGVLIVEEVGKTEELVPQPPAQPTIDELADPLASPEGEQEEHPQQVEVTEGWGLTDWYDTEDARRDADEIERELRLSDQLLRLDPDDVYGLSIRAYYEYLAMDWEAATATYDRLLQLDGTSGAHWNNLALVHKRKGEYEKEEDLYRTSLMLEPDNSNTELNLALCLAHQERFDEALSIMKRLEITLPDDPYADLHRAKIFALMDRKEDAYRYLRRSLTSMRKLDTLHNIEYQQDIRVDPAFKAMREEERFKKLLLRFYGDRPGGWWLQGLRDRMPVE